MLLRLDLGLCDPKLLLCRLKLRRDLPELGLKLSGPLGIRITVATQGCVALAEDSHLVNLLRKLAMLSLGGGSLDSTLAFLRAGEYRRGIQLGACGN